MAPDTVILFFFSRTPNVGTGSEPRRGRQRRRILVDPQIHLAARQTECFAAPAALSSVAQRQYRLDSKLDQSAAKRRKTEVWRYAPQVRCLLLTGRESSRIPQVSYPHLTLIVDC